LIFIKLKLIILKTIIVNFEMQKIKKIKIKL